LQKAFSRHEANETLQALLKLKILDEAGFDSAARFYDWEYKDLKVDIPFYLTYAKKQGSPILELGCGTGRVLIPLVEAGFEAWGIDVSNTMLSIFGKKIKKLDSEVVSRIHVQLADMRRFTLPARFRLAIIPYTTFTHMVTKQDKENCLRRIHSHLSDDGLLIIDVFSPNLNRLVRGMITTLREFQSSQKGQKVILTTHTHYDLSKQTMDVTKIYDVQQSDGSVKRSVQKFTICYMFRYEMEYLLEKEKYSVVSVSGDYGGKEYDYKSERMIFVAKKS
jgi:SAM-dependent methyltransferase